jgi:hypothetical protein
VNEMGVGAGGGGLEIVVSLISLIIASASFVTASIMAVHVSELEQKLEQDER